MLKRWDIITLGYFNREHPYTLPIFDDFGLDEQDNYYYDTDHLNKTEAEARNKNKARIIIETIAENVIYGNAKTMYMACPITSGLYASEWVAKRNAANDFDPLKTIKTTHKLSRHMGPLMGKLVTAPTVRDNLMRGALAMDGNPDLHPLMPVVREMVVKHMSENADFSASQRYEDIDFMAKWYIKIDQCASLVFDGPLTFSRSTDKEINRALLIQAGLHPLRPDADMNITDINGQEVDTNTIYKKMLDTLKYQIGSGIHPKEALTVLLRMNDMFDHLQGKENKISAAREAAGMSKFPENVHPSMKKWVSQDAKAFQKLRDEVDFLAKEYCVSVLSDKELSQLDDKYQQWKNEGFGQMPTYKDGMSPNLRKKLDLCMDDAQSLENFFDHVMPHKNEQDGDALSQKRDELIDLTDELVNDFDRITPRNNGHWNPKLDEIRGLHITPLKSLAGKLATASPSNHSRLVNIALEIKEHAHNVKNVIREVLYNQAISKLRAEARLIAKANLDLQDAVPFKPVSTKAQTAMRQYGEGFEPFAVENEPAVFNDGLFDKLSDREQAILPVLIGAEETTFPSLNQPYTIGVSIDAKALASIGKDADAARIKSLKELYGAAGMEEVAGMNAEALAYTMQAYEYIEKLYPGQIVHGSLGDGMVYKAVEDYSEAIAKKGDSIRMSSGAQMLHQSKFTQLRDYKVFFGAGWASSENEVQKRVRAHEMQLGWIKRDHGVLLDIYTLPKDMSKAPANPQADSLHESISEIDNFIQGELKKGRDVPYKITLGLARLLEIHAMIEDPTIQKDRLNEEKQFTAHEIAPSLITYMRDERKNKLGNRNTPDGIYSKYNDPKTGLFATTNLLMDIPFELLKEKALGLNYTQMQKEVGGAHDQKIVQKPSDDQMHIDQGLHQA
jgi:hypothetical protein